MSDNGTAESHRAPTSGAAYGPGFKAFVTLLTFGLLGYGGRLIAREARGPISNSSWTMIGVSTLMMLGTGSLMRRAATTVDERGIRQGGLMEHSVGRDDVGYLRIAVLAFARIAARYPKPGRR
jgi:hypothetical protein